MSDGGLAGDVFLVVVVVDREVRTASSDLVGFVAYLDICHDGVAASEYGSHLRAIEHCVLRVYYLHFLVVS